MYSPLGGRFSLVYHGNFPKRGVRRGRLGGGGGGGEKDETNHETEPTFNFLSSRKKYPTKEEFVTKYN